ncbi:MAG: pyrroline-5-carboxylate reductase [Bacteroidota bacterium]|nr:pyrroline-5-carboxylate reductase [Bacteroidota bacterium]MDP3147256.1 pyrroline-5-carboxylate reductase [Bacteroidota bacterium]MDP3557370.1 pyrroline-5-carboxylate reductase [Bacteroidota bacterium]
MSLNSITIIGGGNLGKAIAEGLIASKYVKPNQITVTKRNTSTLDYLKKQAVKISSDNKEAVKNASIILLCVKPFQAKEIVKEISSNLNSKQIIVSVVSGINIDELENEIGKKITIFRAMPNTAVAIKQSMTCMCYKNANASQIKIVENLFNTLGKTITIDEKLMDASTVLGACGTAFAMRYIRANIQAGIEIGFDARTASIIAAQTVKGAAQLLIENNSHPEEEIDKVTTPKGVTITGLNQMEHNGLSSSIIKGITEAYKKMNP